jgi:hypothetical protein
MLSHEWRELEVLCERINDLRHRYAQAQQSKNVGLLDGLKNDIATVKRQREQLVQHISARLGSVAAARTRGTRPSIASDASDAAASPASVPGTDHEPVMMCGFQDN